MSEVSVLYFGPLYEIVGKRREKIVINDSSNLDDLLQELRARHGQRLDSFLFDSKGKLRTSIAFAVDGISIARSDLKKMRCGSVSEFVILPPISGG